MNSNILSAPDLARVSLDFWTRECETLAETRQNWLAAGKAAWAAELQPMHSLAIHRRQAAWWKCLRAFSLDMPTLDPCQEFWDSRPDIG